MRRDRVHAGLLAAVLLCGTGLARPDGGDAARWSIERGWPTLPGRLVAGEGWPVEVELGDAPPPWDAAHPPRIEVRVGSAGGWTVAYEGLAGEVLDQYEPDSSLAGGWLREIVYRNTSQLTQDFTELRLRVGFDREPGSPDWNPEFLRVAETRDGSIVGAAFWTHADWYCLADPRPDGVVEVEIHPSWRLEPGQQATVGRMGIWFAGAGQGAMRDSARRWFEARGCQPLTYPAALTRGILYEASAGGHVDGNFGSLGGFDALARQLPMLKRLGVSTIWLNAVAEHGGGNHYGVLDMERIDARLGGEAGLRRLAGEFERHGLQVIGEIVPHGFQSRQAEALPQWWTRRRDGSLARNWGGYGMDTASPPWVDVLTRHAHWLSSEFGISGLRIDIAHGQGFNWGSPRTRHAGDSSVGACLRLMERLGEALARENGPRPVLVPEAPSLPEHFAIDSATVLGYGHGLTNLFEKELPPHRQDAATMVRLIRRQLETERGSLPPGALEIRTLNNHDTIVRSGRAHVRFGLGLARALHAACLSVPGVPMLYQEDEIGSWEVYRRWHRARARLVPLQSGGVRYPPADYFDPRVLAVLRTLDRWSVLCLVNLSGDPVRRSAVIDRSFGAIDSLQDAITGRVVPVDEAGRFEWALPPYGFALLGNRPVVDPVAGPRKFRETSQAGSWALSRAPNADPVIRHGGLSLRVRGLTSLARSGSAQDGPIMEEAGGLRLQLILNDEAAFPEIVVRGARHWGVSGRTALLHDPVVRRRWPYPPEAGYQWTRDEIEGRMPGGALYCAVAPLGRLWQSILEPLHPERPALAFSDGNASAIVIDRIRTNAPQVILTDTSDETLEAPYPLVLRFLRHDPDLAAPIQAQLKRQAGPEGSPATLSLRIRPSREPIESLLEAERLPLEPVIHINLE